MKAYELLSDESKWTKCGIARDMYGNVCPARSTEAICWCAVGAVEKCYDDKEYSINIGRLYMESDGNIGRWNDSTTFEEVKAMLTKLDI